MTREEAIIYFKQCNSKIISVCKDENKYDYEKQEIISDCARKTYEANRLALEALEQESNAEHEKNHKNAKWKMHTVDNGYNIDWKCTNCGFTMHTDFFDYRYCPKCGAEMESD